MPKYYSKFGGYKKRYRAKNTAAKNKKYIQNSRTARAQQKQLTSLQRQITATKSKLKDRTQYAQYFCPIEQGEGSDFSQIDLPDGEFYVNNLMRPSSWTGIFQAQGTQEPT